MPTHTDFFGQEDVDEAVWMPYREWSTVRQFIQRVLDGEKVEAVAIDAVPAMETMRNA